MVRLLLERTNVNHRLAEKEVQQAHSEGGVWGRAKFKSSEGGTVLKRHKPPNRALRLGSFFWPNGPSQLTLVIQRRQVPVLDK
jgi:hypothetical protein